MTVHLTFDDATGAGQPDAYAKLEAEVHALRLALAGLAGDLPETLAERVPARVRLDGFTRDLLERSLADSVRLVGGEFLEPNPGTAATILLALQHAHELPETAIIDTAVIAERLANAALLWQATATAVLAERRELAARHNVLDEDDLDKAIDLARRASVAEVAIVSNATEYRLGQHVRLLRDSIEDHPLVAAAVRCGRVDLPRAVVITDVTGMILDPTRRDRIEQPALQAAAYGVTIPTLRRLLERLLADEAPEEHEAFTRHKHHTCTGVKIKNAGYGLASMTVTADIALIKEAEAAVKTLTEMATTPIDNEHTGFANPAHVVLEELINAAQHGATVTDETGSGSGAKMQINLTVPLSTLVDEQAANAEKATAASDPSSDVQPAHEPTMPDETTTDAPAELAGFGWIPASLARELIHEHGARATWRCHYLDDDPDSPHHGTIVGVGRAAHDSRYAPNLTTRELIIARDSTCRFPGCHRPASGCDLDHITPYNRGGATCSDQMITLCRHHHRLKHHGGFTPRRDGATIIWTTPTGRQIRVVPHRLLVEHEPIPYPDPPF